MLLHCATTCITSQGTLDAGRLSKALSRSSTRVFLWFHKMYCHLGAREALRIGIQYACVSQHYEKHTQN